MCVRASVCVRACVCARVCAGVRARVCVRVCMCACARARARARVCVCVNNSAPKNFYIHRSGAKCWPDIYLWSAVLAVTGLIRDIG